MHSTTLLFRGYPYKGRGLILKLWQKIWLEHCQVFQCVESIFHATKLAASLFLWLPIGRPGRGTCCFGKTGLPFTLPRLLVLEKELGRLAVTGYLLKYLRSDCQLELFHVQWKTLKLLNIVMSYLVWISHFLFP